MWMEMEQVCKQDGRMYLSKNFKTFLMQLMQNKDIKNIL